MGRLLVKLLESLFICLQVAGGSTLHGELCKVCESVGSSQLQVNVDPPVLVSLVELLVRLAGLEQVLVDLLHFCLLLSSCAVVRFKNRNVVIHIGSMLITLMT